MQASFPHLRFEIATCTRSIRATMAVAGQQGGTGGASGTQAKLSAAAAMKAAITHFLKLPFPGK
jgi:hypothetical protein